MTGRKLTSLLVAGAVSVGVACVVLLAVAESAIACVADADGDCFHPNYHVQRTDGTLAEWSGPGTGRIVAWLYGNGTPVEVVCETTGATEDGLPYVVWDQLDNGDYVYGYYLTTPGDGYHPALTRCPGSGARPKPPPTPPPPPPTGGSGSNPPPGGNKSLLPNRFNAAGAAAWARANAMIPPTKAASDPYGFPDDCTDFVSRAMHLGGGMPYVDDVGISPLNHADDHDWYVKSFFGRWIGTHSWSQAGDLLNFLRITGSGRQISLQAARPGDLIFVNWGQGGHDLPPTQTDTSTPGGIDHVGMIVGNPGSRGGYNVQIAQHTHNKIEPLSAWRKLNPHLHVWLYTIYYSYASPS